MRLPNLALVLVTSAAAVALPGRTPLDDCLDANGDQRTLASDNDICSSLGAAKHPGHPFPEPPPSGHETIYTTLSKDPRYFSAIVPETCSCMT